MISYWIYKFEVEDRDIGVVDYQPFENADIEIPVLYTCLENPFRVKAFEDMPSGIDDKTYLKNLQGDAYHSAFENIDYANATIDLKDYFKRATIQLSNDSKPRHVYSHQLTGTLKHEVIFNGFEFDVSPSIRKCFTIRLSKNEYASVKALTVVYDLKSLLKDLTKIKIQVGVHHPKQFLLGLGRNTHSMHKKCG